MTCMRNLWPSFKSQSNSEIIIQEIECDDEVECDDDEAYEEISKELSHFEEKSKPNLNDTEAVNLGDQDNIRETKITVHLEPQLKEEIIKVLFEYKDVFAWSYDDIPGLSTDLVIHKLPTDPALPPVKQKLRKFKTDISVKIKEEITKQFDAKVIRVKRYPAWLANVVLVPKKDCKTRVCVDYRDLNKASPKDNFPLPNIHILIVNCAKHEIGSFVDCYAGYHQILMDEEDAEKTTFITPWGMYCYRVMPFGLKNAGATYMRLTTICEPIFKLLKKDAAVKWTDKCQEAFDKIKGYLSNPPVLVLPEPGRPLILYLTVLDNSFGCVLGQHDVTSRKEQAIYYLSKKFTSYETAMKAHVLADHLVENPVDNDYEPLKTYFPDEEVMHIDELEQVEKPRWRLFFDGDANMKGVGIGAVLISETGQHYPVTAQLRFYCTNNMAEYEACILGLRLAVDMGFQEVLVMGDSDLLLSLIDEKRLSSVCHGQLYQQRMARAYNKKVRPRKFEVGQLNKIKVWVKESSDGNSEAIKYDN
ncbi:uncharacterized protein [Nicotiana sylvestris]|uniref:uncharacterized protein n=1 Tax=Nicotiana sylvestris TaxID=4096 RepID=UPI00388CB099